MKFVHCSLRFSLKLDNSPLSGKGARTPLYKYNISSRAKRGSNMDRALERGEIEINGLLRKPNNPGKGDMRK